MIHVTVDATIGLAACYSGSDRFIRHAVLAFSGQKRVTVFNNLFTKCQACLRVESFRTRPLTCGKLYYSLYIRKGKAIKLACVRIRFPVWSSLYNRPIRQRRESLHRATLTF
jgi:hypothetical protein